MGAEGPGRGALHFANTKIELINRNAGQATADRWPDVSPGDRLAAMGGSIVYYRSFLAADHITGPSGINYIFNLG
jgi:hypothetical protein